MSLPQGERRTEEGRKEGEGEGEVNGTNFTRRARSVPFSKLDFADEAIEADSRVKGWKTERMIR